MALVPMSLVIVAAQIATALGILPRYGFSAYLLGLVYLLALAALHFVLLLIPGSE